MAPEVHREFPDAIEIHSGRPGSFPRTRVLKAEAMERLLDELLSRVCNESITGFPIPRQTPTVRDVVRTYITKMDLTPEEINKVEGPDGFFSDAVRPTLVLLRGLVASNVLAFALTQKR